MGLHENQSELEFGQALMNYEEVSIYIGLSGLQRHPGVTNKMFVFAGTMR